MYNLCGKEKGTGLRSAPLQSHGEIEKGSGENLGSCKKGEP